MNCFAELLMFCVIIIYKRGRQASTVVMRSELHAVALSTTLKGRKKTNANTELALAA